MFEYSVWLYCFELIFHLKYVCATKSIYTPGVGVLNMSRYIYIYIYIYIDSAGKDTLPPLFNLHGMTTRFQHGQTYGFILAWYDK